jgi:hypothetical protein
MANIMGILGGVGQGISAGVQDLERMDEAKNRKEEAQFRKELQQRERERLAEEKRLGEAVKGIKRSREGFTPEQAAANTQAGFTNLPTRDDEGRLVYGATETAIPRSEAELLKEEAALYAASPDMRNRTLGRQLQGEARTLETQDKIRSIQSNYSDTLKAINADPNKWVQDNMAKFNSDEYGGPGTKGVMVAPMSTPKGTVLNVMGPQGQQLQQIPVNKEALARVARSMYFDELAGVNPDYAKLAMDQERLGLEREGVGIKRQGLDLQRTDLDLKRDYQTGMLGVYQEKNRIDADEMKSRSALWGAQRRQAESAMNGFSSFLSQDPDSGVIYGVKKDGTIGSLQGPMDKAGKPVPLFPKTTGAKGTVAKVMKDEDGNTVAYNNDGVPIHNIVGGGLVVPLGVTSSDWNSMKKKATDSGIQISAGKDKEGAPVIAYKGKDGNYYSTLEEARKAKAK